MGTHRFTIHANLVPVEALFLWADLDRVTGWMAVGWFRGSFRGQLRSFAGACERERLGRLIL